MTFSLLVWGVWIGLLPYRGRLDLDPEACLLSKPPQSLLPTSAYRATFLPADADVRKPFKSRLFHPLSGPMAATGQRQHLY